MKKRILLFAAVSLLGIVLFQSCYQGSARIKDKKKIFRYNQTGGLTSLDPALAKNRANIWAVSQIYNGLVTLNENLDAVPELAKEFEVSTDGLVYTFIINTEARFHDNPCFKETNGRGRKITAHDFVYSFNRILDSKTGSTGRWVFDGKVLDGGGLRRSDTCFKAVNDSTLKIYLVEKNPLFLNLLAMPYAFVVPWEAVNFYGFDFGSNPVGTGPFQMVSWDRGQSLTLQKNKDYWKVDKATGRRLPFLDGIQVSFVDNAYAAFLDFTAGELEFITSISPASKDAVLEKDGRLKEEFTGKFTAEKTDYLNTEYIGFDVREGRAGDNNPFLNKKIRQALGYAVNREELVSYLRNGLGVPGNYGFVPHALPSFDTTAVRGYKYNVRKAKQLLKEAGYPEGAGMAKITLNTYTSDQEIAGLVKKNWEAIGLEVEIELNQFSSHQLQVDNGACGVFRGSWLADYPDAENFLRLFYGNKRNRAPYGPNKTGFSNSTFDGLFENIHNDGNLFERYRAYQKMDSIVMAEAPVIVLYYDEVVHLKQNYVTGLKINKMNTLILENVDFIDQAQ